MGEFELFFGDNCNLFNIGVMLVKSDREFKPAIVC
jgi:hypothetical protein